MTEWITDRQPTEADGDCDGDVSCKQHPDQGGSALIHWSHIGAGVPWRHTTYWQPPAQPEIRVGQIWKRRDGVEVRIARDDNSDHRPILSVPTVQNGFAHDAWHRRDGKVRDMDSGYDLVTLVHDVPAAEPEPDPEPTPTIPAHLRVGAVPFYVLVVSNGPDGQAIVLGHELPQGGTIESVMQQQQDLGTRLGTTYVAECRILPELTRHA
jgi:hypothetical protein